MQYNNHEFCTSKIVVKDDLVFLLIENENSKVVAFNSQGDELFQVSLGYQGQDIQIDDNKVYINAYSTIYRYSCNENTLSPDWYWHQTENFHISTLHFDKTQQLLFECCGSIYFLSQEGNYIKTLTFPEVSIDFFQITPDNHILFGNKDLYKYDMEGKLIWRSDIGHNSITNNFNCYQTISEDGYIYSPQSYGLIAINPSGEFIWYEDSRIRKIAPPVLDNKQNVVCTNSYYNRIVCIKGDADQ
jgi:outer membrane protein assembly factor BamB